MAPDDVDLKIALGLLSLPRDIGKDPESGEMIIAGIGRFGSYVKLGKTYANLEQGDEVLNIGLNRAVTLIAEKKANPGKGRRFGADPGRSLGDHPDKGGPIVVKNGRYGAYVTHDGVNATLPGDKTPDTITLEEAISLLDARIAAGGGGKKRKTAPQIGRKQGCSQSLKGRRGRETGQGQSQDAARHGKESQACGGGRRREQAGEDIHRTQGIVQIGGLEVARENRRSDRRRKDAGRRRPHGTKTQGCALASEPSCRIGRQRPHHRSSWPARNKTPPFPSREQLLAFIKDHTGEAGTREIARAFGLKNADRARAETGAARPRRRGRGR